MRTTKQDFYDEFKCIADKCPMTCCSGWQIVVDELSLDRFQKYNGPIENRIKTSIDWEEGTIHQYENRDCAFLNKNGLCDLITAEGDSILCDTCRLYPRHVEEFEDLREWSMSLSCPEVARIFLNKSSVINLVHEDDDEPDPLEEDFEDFDFILFSKLQDSRDVMFKIISNSSLTISERAGLVLELSKRLQEFYDSGDYFFMDDCLEDFSNEQFLHDNAAEYDLTFSGVIDHHFEILEELETLCEDWEDTLALIEFYNNAKHENFIEGISEDHHQKILENLFNALLYTYYLGSIYNGMIYAYTKMSLFAVITVDSLALSLSNKLGRKITLDEYSEVLYKYSRETEHSDDNICAMLEYFDL